MAGSNRERDRRRDWQHRARILNRILDHCGLSLDNWQNRHYVLSDRKGRSEIVADLGALWPAVGQLLGRPLDPLDPKLIEALSGDRLAGEVFLP